MPRHASVQRPFEKHSHLGLVSVSIGTDGANTCGLSLEIRLFVSRLLCESKSPSRTLFQIDTILKCGGGRRQLDPVGDDDDRVAQRAPVRSRREPPRRLPHAAQGSARSYLVSRSRVSALPDSYLGLEFPKVSDLTTYGEWFSRALRTASRLTVSTYVSFFKIQREICTFVGARHWVVLSQLSLSIILSFFFETNQDVLQFLNSLQLRTLFSMLVLVFSGTAALCVDLSDPFRGGYSIKTSVTQLIVLERT